jgi:hypothetical protein
MGNCTSKNSTQAQGRTTENVPATQTGRRGNAKPPKHADRNGKVSPTSTSNSSEADEASGKPFTPDFHFYTYKNQCIGQVDKSGRVHYLPVDFKNQKYPNQPSVFIEGDTIYLAGGERRPNLLSTVFSIDIKT